MQKVTLYLWLFSFLFACSKPSDNPDGPLPIPHEHYAIIKGENGEQYHTGLLQSPSEFKYLGDSYVRFNDCGALPDSFDLRPLGVVPPIRNQGNCGSCWAHSLTKSFVSALMGVGILKDLSVQDLVSCDKSQYGCGGGTLNGFKYQISHGQSLESDYPYTSGRNGSTGSCKRAAVAAKGVSFQFVGSSDRGPTDEELKCALYKFRTVPWVTVGATDAWGRPPKSEKTAYRNCGRSQTNHAVNVVGWWTDEDKKVQWIMPNSWGPEWGDKGYMSLPLGCNAFGEEVAFIEVAKPEPTPTPPGPTPTPPGPTPSPTPCQAPKAKLPAEIQYMQGTEVMLGVKAETGVNYIWVENGQTTVLGSESMLYVTPAKDTIYKLTAKNACATSESLVRVRLVMSFKNR